LPKALSFISSNTEPTGSRENIIWFDTDEEAIKYWNGSIWTELARGIIGSIDSIKFALIAGGAAGDHTITGIEVGDELISIEYLISVTILAVSVIASDNNLTSQFTISADNTINNTGGTNTSAGILRVMWIDRTP